MRANPAAADAASARARLNEIERSVLKITPSDLQERLQNGTVESREEVIRIVAPEVLPRWRALCVTLEELRKHGG